MPSAVKKYSIKEVDVLITSITSLSGETEEAICKALGYNEGYIAQLRSREKVDEVPQVSPKFYNILSDYRNKALLKANKMQGKLEENGHAPTDPLTILKQWRADVEQKYQDSNKRELALIAIINNYLKDIPNLVQGQQDIVNQLSVNSKYFAKLLLDELDLPRKKHLKPSASGNQPRRKEEDVNEKDTRS